MRAHRLKLAARVVGAVLLLTGLSAARPPCTLKAQTVQSDSRHFTLVVTYPKQCEVSMDAQPQQIVLRVARSGGAYALPAPTHTPGNRSASSGTTTAATADTLASLIRRARSKIGSRYVYSATGPDHFDCSGFVYYLFRSEGIAIPRTSRDQSQMGPPLTRAQLRRGDLVFFDTGHRGHINHSGLYLGDGRFIHATSGKAYGVTISRLDRGFYDQAFRWGVRVIGPQPQPALPDRNTTSPAEANRSTSSPKTPSTHKRSTAHPKTPHRTKTRKTPVQKHRKPKHPMRKPPNKHTRKKMTLKEGVDRLVKRLKK